MILVVLESRILEGHVYFFSAPNLYFFLVPMETSQGFPSLMQGQTDLHQKRNSLGFVPLVQVGFQIYDFRTTHKSEF